MPPVSWFRRLSRESTVTVGSRPSRAYVSISFSLVKKTITLSLFVSYAGLIPSSRGDHMRAV